ncbi:MAG: hypothetical protein JWN38_1202 [Candidatus Saccharibacteria bacterium]|nr:hypothetical protein [Candidatus Saccharibacteria bacterium]
MRKFQKQQDGFSAVEAILLLVIVAIVGFVGWYVLNANQNTDEVNAETRNTATAAASVAPTSKSTTAQKYLTIKEWGVRLPYGGTDTLSYTYGNSSVQVVSKQLADKYGCTSFGAGIFSRNHGTDTLDSGGQTYAAAAKANPSAYVHVGDYYYGFSHDQAACSDTVTVDSENAANDFTKTLLHKIEVTPTH